MTAPRTAVLVVERNFLSQHIGVRRVILHYWSRLVEAGTEVVLATPDGQGGLLEGDAQLLQAPPAERHRALPDWTSRRPDLLAPAAQGRRAAPAIVEWRTTRLSPASFDVMLVTAPWLCEHPLAAGENTVGIVYDMVPNLLAIGALNFPAFIDIFQFAAQHDAGYRYYLANARRILCISQATRTDFLRFYPSAQNRTLTDIPFDIPVADPAMADARSPHTVLLVNALDQRKNLDGIIESLILLRQDMKFSLWVVGRERIALPEVLDRLNRLASIDIDIEWYRDAPDATLDAFYDKASVLLFPSFYEGLGLPILEAQRRGLPVVSSDTSSCGEINLNPALCASPRQPTEIAQRLLDVLKRRHPVLEGNALRQAQTKFLSHQMQGAEALSFM